MPDLIGLFGIRLQLLIGRPEVPQPAPYEVVDSLISVQVTNNDRERDGFQMEFSWGKIRCWSMACYAAVSWRSRTG